MKVQKYYTVTKSALITASVLIGIISASVVIINNSVREYLQLPIVTFEKEECVQVENFKNGEAYQCSDVNVVLRHYRSVKK